MEQRRQRVSSAGGENPVDDGRSWRKYGQKEILGAKHPRLAHLSHSLKHVLLIWNWNRALTSVVQTSQGLLPLLAPLLARVPGRWSTTRTRTATCRP